MTTTRFIARLDIKGPNLVKGIRYEGVRVIGNPQEYAEKYYKEGIDEVIYLDTVASLYNRISLHDLVAKTAKGDSKTLFTPPTELSVTFKNVTASPTCN